MNRIWKQEILPSAAKSENAKGTAQRQNRHFSHNCQQSLTYILLKMLSVILAVPYFVPFDFLKFLAFSLIAS